MPCGFCRGDGVVDMTLPKRLLYVLSALVVCSAVFWYMFATSGLGRFPLLKAIPISATLVWAFILPRGLKSLTWVFASVAMGLLVGTIVLSIGRDTFVYAVVFFPILFVMCAPGILLAHGMRYVIKQENILTGILIGILMTMPFLILKVLSPVVWSRF